MSLKAYEPLVQIALVHDGNAIKHLSEAERAMFDVLIEADPMDYTVGKAKQYQRMKLCAYKYSPFANTLYIDVDTLWFPEKKVSELIAHLMEYDFYIGKNGEYNPLTRKKIGSNYTFWGEPARISRYFRLKNPLPQTISGVFWFRKCQPTERIFNRALQIYNDQQAPTQKWANGKADEYCFNVALSEVGYVQQNAHIVYFDKSNGDITRDQMYDNFWGMAAGGNRLSTAMKDLYNELVSMYHSVFKFDVKRLHIDKMMVIKERRNY